MKKQFKASLQAMAGDLKRSYYEERLRLQGAGESEIKRLCLENLQVAVNNLELMDKAFKRMFVDYVNKYDQFLRKAETRQLLEGMVKFRPQLMVKLFIEKNKSERRLKKTRGKGALRRLLRKELSRI